MATTLLDQIGGDPRPAEHESRTAKELEEDRRASKSGARRHLGVRLLLTLVVLLPMLGTAVLIASSATSA
jgi:hypothetical protein